MEPTPSDNVKVAIRVRQLIQKEVNNGLKSHWTVRNDTITCNGTDGNGKTIPPYIFDRVFDETSITMDLFEDICKPIVDGAVEGMNGTIFAYGQSSSGKTFTMLGSKVQPGIISLSIGEIFNSIDNLPNREFLIRVGYLEIYNERVSDLLSPTENILKLQDDTDHNVQVVGLTEEMVNDQKKLLDVIQKGNAKRHTAETKQNDRSSRSHCILRIVIESRQIGHEDEAVIVSNLYFVDLAGSEKASENSGDRLREGCAINKSLFTLGMVIRKLTGDTSQQHVSFRDSKLTRILKNALGGNSKTAIICNMTPAHIEESDSTLKFASRAKNICNKPIVNEVMSDEALLKSYRSKINKLENQIKEMSTTSVSMEKVELEKRLQEKEAAQKKQAEMIAKLQTMIVKAGPISIEEPPKKKRRETWCPGKMSRPLLIPAKLSTSPQVDKLDISEFKAPPAVEMRLPDVMMSATLFEEEMPPNMAQANDTICENPAIKELFEWQDKYEETSKQLERKDNELIELKEFHEIERQIEAETIKDLKKQIKNLEDSKPWIEEELIKTQQERNKLRQQVETLNMRLSAVEDGSGITAKAQKLSETETRLDDVNKELKLQKSRSEFHTEQMKRRIEALTLILEEMGVDAETLKHKLGSDSVDDREIVQVKANEADLEKLQKEIDMLIEEKTEREIEVQELLVYKEKFEEQDVLHQKALEDAKEEIDSYRQLYEEEAKKGTIDSEGNTDNASVDLKKEIQVLKVKLEASQKTVAENDKDFEDLLSKFESEKCEMKNTIKELEKQLEHRPTVECSGDSDLVGVLEMLKQQLVEKDEEVQALKKELEASETTKSESSNQDILLQYESENSEMKVRLEEMEKRLESTPAVSSSISDELRAAEDSKISLLLQELEQRDEEIKELKLRVDDSEKSTSESSTDKENLLLQYESEKSEMKSRIEELENKIESSSAVSSGINEALVGEEGAKLKLLIQELDQKDEEIKELKLRIDETNKSSSESTTENLVLQYESENTDLKKKITDLENRLVSSLSDVTYKSEKMEKEETDREFLKEELVKKESEIQELKLKLESENGTDSEDLLNYRLEISELKNRIEELEAEKDVIEIAPEAGDNPNYKLEIKELKNRIEELEAEKGVIETAPKSEDIPNYELENSELKNRIELLEKQLESNPAVSVDKAHLSSSKSMSSLCDDIEFDENKQKTSLGIEMKESEILELRTKLEASEKSLAEKNEELENLIIKHESELSDMENRIKEQDERLETSEPVTSLLRSVSNDKNEDNEGVELKQKYETKEEELDILRSKLEASEKTKNEIKISKEDVIHQYESQISEMKLKIEELETRLAANSANDYAGEKIEMDWDSEVEMFKQELSKREEEIKELKSKLVANELLSSENSEMKNRIGELESQLNSSSAMSDGENVVMDRDSKLESLKQENENKELEIQELRTKLEASVVSVQNQSLESSRTSNEADVSHIESIEGSEEKMVLDQQNEKTVEELKHQIKMLERMLDSQKPDGPPRKRRKHVTFSLSTEERIREDSDPVEKPVLVDAEQQTAPITTPETQEEMGDDQNKQDDLQSVLEETRAELQPMKEQLQKLLTQIDQLQSSKAVLKSEKQELLLNNEMMQERVDQCEEDLKDAQEKLMLAEERIEELKNIADEKEEELKIRIEQSEDEVKEAQEKFNMAEERMEELKKFGMEKIEEFKKRVEDGEADLTEAHEKLTLLEERNLDLKNAVEEKEEELKMSIAQSEKLLTEKQELLQAIGDLQERADQNEEDLKETQRKLNVAEETIVDMRNLAEEKVEAIKKGELGESQAEVETMRGQIKQLCEEIDQLNTDKAALKEEKQELFKANELMQERVDQIEEDLNESEKKFSMAEDRIEELKKLAEEKMEEMKKMVDQNEKLTTEKQELLQAVEVLQEKVDQSEEDVKEATRKLNIAEESIEELKNLADQRIEAFKKGELGESQAEVETMREQLQQLCKEIDQLNTDKAALEEEKQELFKTKELMQENADLSEKELKEAQMKLDAAEEKIKQMQNLAAESKQELTNMAESKVEAMIKRLELREQEFEEAQGHLQVAEEKIEEMKEELERLQTENDSLKDDVMQYEENMPPDTIKVNLQTDSEWEKKWIEFTREEKRKRMLLRLQIRELNRQLSQAEHGVQCAKERALQELIENGKEKEMIAELEQKYNTVSEEADKLNWDLDDEKKINTELKAKIAALEKQQQEMGEKKGAFIATDDHNCKYKVESVKASMELKDFKWEMDKKLKAHEESVKYYNDKIAELKNEMRRLASGMDNTVCMMSNKPVQLDFGGSEPSTSMTADTSAGSSTGSSVRSGIIDHFKVCITENENKRLKKELEKQKALTGKEDELNKENVTLKNQIKRLKEEIKKVKVTTPLKTLNSPAKQRDPLPISSCKKSSPTLSAPSIAEMMAATSAPQPVSSDFFNMDRSARKPLSSRKKPEDDPNNCKTT